VPYVPNAPYGPDLPFAAEAPVAHYFGLGGYLRPAAELASAGVRFAAECLAFSNPPAPSLCRALGLPGDAAWRRGIPRDAGTAWDFEDVRDHYVRTLFGVSPAALRRQDPEAWLAQGRAAMALLFEQALGTWRSDGVCAGAIALMLNDVLSGAGWGLLDAGLRPKSAWHGFRRAAQPVQIVLRDTGLNGVQLHGLNESATPRTVRLALRGLTPEGAVEPLGERFVILPARGALVVPATAMMGRWRDLGAVWGFGPAAFHALGATLHDAADGGLLSEATLFPGGPGQRFGPPAGLSVALREAAAGWQLDIGASGFAPFVTIDDDGCVAADEFFHLWPGETRVVALEPLGAARPRGVVGCLTGGAAYYEAAA
jgi:beta-mannosidase